MQVEAIECPRAKESGEGVVDALLCKPLGFLSCSFEEDEGLGGLRGLLLFTDVEAVCAKPQALPFQQVFYASLIGAVMGLRWQNNDIEVRLMIEIEVEVPRQ